jgi:hypothetical protein
MSGPTGEIHTFHGEHGALGVSKAPNTGRTIFRMEDGHTKVTISLPDNVVLKLRDLLNAFYQHPQTGSSS